MNGFALEILENNRNRDEQIALVDRNGARKITWESLKDRVCRVAAYARAQGLSGIVPVFMDRGMECTATLLGLNLAGCGVAPLSVTTPTERCKNICEQTGNALWAMETFKKAVRCLPAYELMSPGKEADPAYVVFTSGSTGNPKGVMLSNRAVLSAVIRISKPEFFDLKENDRLLQTASISFVAVIPDLFCPLYAGATVYFMPEEARGDANMMKELINRFGIHCFLMPPQLYRKLEIGPSVRCVCTGSDKVVNVGPGNHRLVNCYGMSETACFSFYYEIRKPMEQTPIGVPCEEFRAYVLDENGNEAEEGELCVSGPVAHGYLGMEELSRKTFTKNPFSEDPDHQILLHTGDLARKLPEGGYLYLNRKDNMIKINGQRVEPGEIESVIMNCPGVDVAAVKGFTDENQRSYLCGYYTCNREIDEEKLKETLHEKLPHYMVPGIFIKLERMPLNSNGKLYRKALPVPDFSLYQTVYEAPEGEKEALLCRAFEKVLGLDKVGRNEDFFTVGGDSITALNVVSECAALGISTGDIFIGRTPKAIAALSDPEDQKIYYRLPTEIKKTKLTDSQLGILLECGLEEATDKYNIPVCLDFDRTEGMTASSVKEAVDRVLENHPALYAGIIEDHGDFYMLREAFPAEGIAEAEETENFPEDQILPMAIGRDPLCSAKIRLNKEKVHVLMNLHHVVSDGSSVAVLVKELEKVLSGETVPPETVDAFSLYEAEKRRKASVRREEAKTYFEHLLADAETDSNLIPDHKAKEDSLPVGKRESFCLPTAEIKAYLNDTGLTESTFFMGVYGYVLAKMTGQNDSVFGAAENGRDHSRLGDTVSMLVRTLPVVMKIDEEKNGLALLKELQAQFFATLRNDCVGFNELAKEYGVRSDCMFVYQAEMLNDTGKIRVSTLATKETISNLNLMVLKRPEGYECRLEYRADLYEKRTAERFIELYEKAVRAFTGGRALKEMTLIGDRDLAFLNEQNRSLPYEPSEETILDIFKKSVTKQPEKKVIVTGGRNYTYKEADEISDRIASYLLNHDIGRGSVVSILIPRSEYMLLASLGVMKAGAAYQPLDPSYPEERLQFMTDNAKAAFLIKDRSLDPVLKGFSGPVLYTDEITNLPEKNREFPKPAPEDVYILLYTSGTTGTPKGVMLCHENLRAYVYAAAAARELTEDSVVTQYASYGFDAHMLEIYPALLLGCTIVVVPEEIRLDLAGIKEFCEEKGVTHLFMTTQVARQFALAYPEVKGLRCLDTGGEKLVSFTPVNSYKINNLYGPTEGTVCSTKFELDRYYENIPIGKAVGSYRLFVVDSYGRRVPVGVPGELVQCGPQVGLGYLGRPDLTEKVFVKNTYEDDVDKAHHRCYKTGDIVRFIDDGNVEYIGRRDHQVKIRGFRIELGEVEKAIRDYAKVKDATVSVIEGNSGKNLCAYVVAEEKIDPAALGRFIAESHPAYMIPAVIMQIDSIPLNVNGKVDKRKLPVPEMHFEDVKKPENGIQKQIFDCVSEAIGTEEFGIDTDIFMAGLSSIGSIRLCTLLSGKFSVPVRIRDLKKYETVKGLEKFIREAAGIKETVKNGPVSETGVRNQTEKDKDVRPVQYGESHPITKTMEGIFIECLQRPGSTVYNIPYLLKLGNGIDEARLKKAIVSAVEAHPCMKAELYTEIDGTIRQHRRSEDEFTEKDIKTVTLKENEAVDGSLVTPFELTGARLFEIVIIHADALYLLVNIHHIISDGTSMTVFLKDVEKAYEGETLLEETFSAFDVVEEESKSRTKAELEEEKAYYEKLLEGTDKDFLPLSDQPEEALPASGALHLTEEEASFEVIRAFCEKHRLSMNAFFLSVFGTVLSAYAGTDYSVFNTVYNGRNDSRTVRTVAMLVHTLPVVCHTDRETVLELVKDMSGELMDSMSNDLYSYAEITRSFGVKNDVMFIFQGDSFVKTDFCNEPAKEIPLALSDQKAPLTLQVLIREGKLCYELDYDPKRFTGALAEAFVHAFDQAAAEFTRKEKLADITFLSEKEEARMEKYNETADDYDRSRTIADFFLEKVKEKPAKLCVEYNGKSYTYAEIGTLTARLSWFLMNQGVGRGDIVAILIHRDENMVIGAHGVIRAGAAYLGLDPTYPAERLEFMVRDSKAKYLIADRSLKGLLKDYQGPVIFTDEIAALPLPSEKDMAEMFKRPEHCITPEDNALIIYSSGTTGLPKGSLLRHRNIVCFYHNYTKDMMINGDARVATYASFGFDGGAMDVFSVPMAGASLYIVPDEIRMDLSLLEQFYVKHGITSGFMTTQVGCMFISHTKCRTLRSFLVGGEKLIPVTGPDWVNFRNGYGPSEAMCYVNLYQIKNAGKLQPIGRTSRNIKEYIIDKKGHRLPFGACGELCISGGQVGKGYLGRPEKTAEVFVRNPFSKDPDYAVMYRTGDVVRQLPDGNYDFVGRRDGQVKIRGFRIELSEVEQQIRKFPGITKTVVRACDSPSGGKFLVSYIVMNEKLDQEELRSFIGKEKPDYMIPQVLIQVDDIPLTSNGKVDYAKLPKPELGSLKKGAEPVSETEEKICAIFGEVLSLEKVYADDDFFKIGGSSISAIQVVVKCEQAGFPVVYKNLFANPTPQKLAIFLREGTKEERSAADFNKNEEYDYSALSCNVIPNLPGIKNEGVGDVLLTGVTGFLGSHVFRELIESTDGKITCLIRSKKKISSENRFEAIMTYYFEDWYQEEMKDRTFIIDGDLEDGEIIEKISKEHIDTIINCAANVKHFAVENELLGSNYSGVENLIDLAEKTGAKLIQISTLSVCGESVDGSVPKDFVFKESDLNIGQSLENQYIYTKFLGEQAVIDAISRKRIRGKIIRLGNLMARINDSEFQVNADQNGMLRMYLGFVKLGSFPVSMLDAEIEFSPIDMVAKAVVLLSGTQDKYTVFHAKNCNAIHYGYLMKAIIEAGYPVEIVEDDVFETRLKKALENTERAEELGGLLAYRNEAGDQLANGASHSGDENVNAVSEHRSGIATSTAFTTKALYRLGFGWPLISMDYLREMVRILKDLDFFEA